MLISKIKGENLNKIIKLVKRPLKEGKVIIFPTDTVYGLICDAKNKKAIKKLFQIKKRSFEKPISLFVKNLKMAKEVAKINKNQGKFLKKVWPGKTIVILKVNPSAASVGSPQARLRMKDKFPKGIVCQWGKIGLRIPDYKLLNELLNVFSGPLAQTSANISGKPASWKIKETLKQFEKGKNQPDLIIDAGNLPKNKSSKVIDLTGKNPKIIRE